MIHVHCDKCEKCLADRDSWVVMHGACSVFSSKRAYLYCEKGGFRWDGGDKSPEGQKFCAPCLAGFFSGRKEHESLVKVIKEEMNI